MARVVVLGSCMTDLVAQMDRFPEAGETLFGNSFNVFQGGKGANQCVSLARLGSDVLFIGKVGNDAYGDAFVKLFNEEKIPNIFFRSKDTPSGIGHIQINSKRQNRIAVIRGANITFSMEDLETVKEEIKKAKYLLCQLEMTLDVTFEALKFAKINGVTTILNTAPAAKIPEEYIPYIDYITPNETELGILAERKTETLEEILQSCEVLLDKGFKNIVTTIGHRGALYYSKTQQILVKPFKVTPIDTVGAGDSFNGAFVYALEKGMDIKEALIFANAMGALTVTKEGAIPSLHHLEEVMAFKNSQEVETIVLKGA